MHKNFFANNAEGGYAEKRTSLYIEKYLIKLGFKVVSNIAKTGVLAILERNKIDECVLFRADMDAIQTTRGIYKHLCGHDAHMAILLVVAEEIMENAEQIQGTVKLFFQPAEELSEGARSSILEGILENPRVTKVFGLHVWSDLNIGEVAIADGELMASGGQFQIEIHGKAAHAAMPHEGIDSIIIGCNIVEMLQMIISHRISPLESSVLTVGTFNSGICDNILSSYTKITGTIRYFNEKVKEELLEKISGVLNAMEQAYKCNIKFEYEEKVPFLINDTKIGKNMQKIFREKYSVITDYKTMCVDDFAEYLMHVPGCYILVGNKDKIFYPQHHEKYYVTNKTMEIGTQILLDIASEYLICERK